MTRPRCTTRLDECIRESASQHSAALASWLLLRSIRPYNYSPCPSNLPQRPKDAIARLRQMLVAHESAFVGFLRNCTADAEQLMSDVLVQLSDLGVSSNLERLTAFSRLLDPGQSMGQLVAVAQLIPAGRTDEAENILLNLLEAGPSPALRSRLLANLALVYEVREDGKQARAFAFAALNCDKVSPLAIANYELYCVKHIAG